MNASSSGSAASSATLGVAATRSVVCAPPAVAHGAPRVVGEREDLAGRAREAPAAGRQHERAAAADVEVVAELASQGSDRARYGGLGDVERARRGLDGAEPRDGQEGSELRQGQLSKRFIRLTRRS